MLPLVPGSRRAPAGLGFVAARAAVFGAADTPLPACCCAIVWMLPATTSAAAITKLMRCIRIPISCPTCFIRLYTTINASTATRCDGNTRSRNPTSNLSADASCPPHDSLEHGIYLIDKLAVSVNSTMQRRWGRVVIVVAALAVVCAPVPPGLVERQYSMRAYITLQHLLTSTSNRVSFALFDLSIAIVAPLWIAFAWRDVRRSTTWPRAAARIGVRTTVWCAAAYLIFIATWGLNYRRTRLADKLPFDASAVTADAALAAARL